MFSYSTWNVARAFWSGLPERRHQVLEAGAPVLKFGAGARDLESIGHPLERALEIAEPVIVDTGLPAEEVTLELPAALEEMERAGEVALAVQR